MHCVCSYQALLVLDGDTFDLCPRLDSREQYLQQRGEALRGIVDHLLQLLTINIMWLIDRLAIYTVT